MQKSTTIIAYLLLESKAHFVSQPYSTGCLRQLDPGLFDRGIFLVYDLSTANRVTRVPLRFVRSGPSVTEAVTAST